MDQVYIDREELVRRVFDRLGPSPQVGLRDVVAAAPLEQGLAELIGYLSLAELGECGVAVVFDDQHREQIGWTDHDVERIVDMPRVTFSQERVDNA